MGKQQKESLQDPLVIADAVAKGHVFGLVMRAWRRHKRVSFRCFLVVAGLSAAGSLAAPKRYTVEARILVSDSAAISSGVDPAHKVQDDRTAGGSSLEFMKSRTSLVAIADDIKLPQIWQTQRSLLGNAADWLRTHVLGPLNKEQLDDVFYALLSDHVKAQNSGNVVQIQSTWSDADTALRIAEGTVAHYLQQRRDSELAQISEPVNILERKVLVSKQRMEGAVARMQKTFEQKERALRAQNPRRQGKTRTIVVAYASPGFDPAVNQLRAKEGQYTQAKHNYEAAVKKAEQNLATLMTSLGPLHPDVVEAKQQLQLLSRPPAELSKIASETQGLVRQANARMPKENSGTLVAESSRALSPMAASGGAGQDVQVHVSTALYQALDKDPELASMMAEIKRQQGAHDAVVGRFNSALIAREAANAAFESRYLVTLPPILPLAPSRPLGLLILGLGMTLAVFISMFAAVVVEVRRGRITEAWQIERFLHTRFLGEVESELI